MTHEKFEALLSEAKVIASDISRTEDKGLSNVSIFRVKIGSSLGYPLIIKGSHNHKLGKTSYTLFTGDLGRIFSVDYDRRHGDAGNFHVHRWDGALRKCIATEAKADIKIAKDPIVLWSWFCEQAGIDHQGALLPLPPVQQDLVL